MFTFYLFLFLLLSLLHDFFLKSGVYEKSPSNLLDFLPTMLRLLLKLVFPFMLILFLKLCLYRLFINFKTSSEIKLSLSLFLPKKDNGLFATSLS